MAAAHEKHLAFFNLIDAVQSDRCPVCYRARLREKRYFETLLYENVNNREFRAELRAAGGFCAAHAHRLKASNDGLAIAVMHLELLETAAGNGALPPETVPRRRASRRAEPERRCPVCRVVEQEAHSTITLIGRYAADQEFLAAYRDSPGLCLPHFARLVEKSNRSHPAIAEHQQQRLEQLIRLTRRFIDSENATSSESHALSREERLVWKRIIDHYYGCDAT